MEEEFSAEAMRGISQSARAISMRQKYKKVVELINVAAQQGETEVIITPETTNFSYELFDWLKRLGFRVAYIHRGYNLKSNIWDCSDNEYDYMNAHWVRIAW